MCIRSLVGPLSSCLRTQASRPVFPATLFRSARTCARRTSRYLDSCLRIHEEAVVKIGSETSAGFSRHPFGIILETCFEERHEM